jgi:hypothetical protein
MSALDGMSASLLKAYIGAGLWHVRFVPHAEIGDLERSRCSMLARGWSEIGPAAGKLKGAVGCLSG